MRGIETVVTTDASEADRRFVVQSLVAYNGTRAASEDYRELTVLSRSEGVIVGGLIGYTHWNWLYIQQLWVAEDHRGRGVGSSLMAAAEGEALARGCLHAHCDTFISRRCLSIRSWVTRHSEPWRIIPWDTRDTSFRSRS